MTLPTKASAIKKKIAQIDRRIKKEKAKRIREDKKFDKLLTKLHKRENATRIRTGIFRRG